jgi:enoyl-CoA hydratase
MAVVTSKVDETLLIAIDRPPVNALDLDTIVALDDAFAKAAKEAPAGGVVLTGGGQVCYAGVDTRAFASYSRDQRHAIVRTITRMIAHLLAIPVPVVAAINGHALVKRQIRGTLAERLAALAASGQDAFIAAFD